jgi:hypothetical protein
MPASSSVKPHVVGLAAQLPSIQEVGGYDQKVGVVAVAVAQ